MRVLASIAHRTMTQDEQKKLAAQAALKHVVEDKVVGVGSGSTVNLFIDALASIKNRIEGRSEERRVGKECRL